jgi:glycosyltransferase involved in cell wall biosynthesis
MDNQPFFSVIIPVKNEAGLLKKALSSLKNLNYPSGLFEVIIADGLSVDDTRKVAGEFSARVVTNEKQIVVSGRNRAFKEAKGELVAFTDADCLFEPGWLANSVKYFGDEKVAGVGGVSLIPEESTHFERAVDFLFRLAGMLGTSCHWRRPACSIQVKDIPGCNAIYRRQALEEVMPVDENLLTAEDVWMNFCIRKNGHKLISACDVMLWHCRRSSPYRLFRQAYRFAIGRLQVGKRNLSLLNFLHVLVGLYIPLFFLSGLWAVLSGFILPWTAIFFLSLFFLSAFCLWTTRSLSCALLTPYVFIIFLFGWSLGFLKELIFPLKDAKGK